MEKHSLALANIKLLLDSLRNNDWYITAFDFSFCGSKYVVVFEDLRELGKGSKYYAVNLTFIDIKDEGRVFETQANAYGIKEDDKDAIMAYFGFIPRHGINEPIWAFYTNFNPSIPIAYSPIKECYKGTVLNVIENRVGKEGFCCYMVRHNGKNSKGQQIYRSAQNTAKAKLLRESLFKRLGERDKTISFCFRSENELSDIEIIRSLFNKAESNP